MLAGDVSARYRRARIIFQQKWNDFYEPNRVFRFTSNFSKYVREKIRKKGKLTPKWINCSTVIRVCYFTANAFYTIRGTRFFRCKQNVGSFAGFFVFAANGRYCLITDGETARARSENIRRVVPAVFSPRKYNKRAV